MAEGTGSSIQSVERAARILGFFTPNRPRMTLAEITARLDVSRATAHRYVVALRGVNLIRYDPASGSYTLGPQILTLGAAALAGLPLLSVARPHMEDLVRTLDETVVLSVWDGEAPIIAEVIDATQRLVRISIRTGARLPMFGSAQGRLFCAFLPEGERPVVPDEIRAEVEEIREVGTSVGSDVAAGIRAVAAPVFRGQVLVATLTVVGTTTAIPGAIDSIVAMAVRESAKQLSGDMGFVADSETSTTSEEKTG